MLLLRAINVTPKSDNGLEVIRTPNLLLAKQALYQIELQAQ